MASKTRYTEEFKKKVAEEYKKGDLSLEEVAAKYGLSPALLQESQSGWLVVGRMFTIINIHYSLHKM